MIVACAQMDVALARPEENFAHACELIRAAAPGADTVMLPETWNVGFFPRENLSEMADRDTERVRSELGALAAELKINLVAGSVANLRDGKVYNTACVFDRTGACIAQYDKTHLFSPMGEHEHFTPGEGICRFTLDGVSCGLIICYDLRFPELIRTMALEGLDLLFVPAEWPDVRLMHWQTLHRARAIENQMFVCACNGCGTAGQTRYGGGSLIIDPWGEILASAGGEETVIRAECDFSVVENIRNSINVFADRRPELYRCGR